MKRPALLILALGVISVLPAAAQTGNAPEKVLVVYFSKTGYTRQVAEHVRSLAGGDIREITAADAYPDSYNATLDRARQERNRDARPEIRIQLENTDPYDTVFLGFPIWFGSLPMPVVTFLEQYNFSGKTIVPFCTSGSSGIGQSVAEIRRRLPEARVTDGFQVSSGGARSSKNDVAAWLRRIGILK